MLNNTDRAIQRQFPRVFLSFLLAQSLYITTFFPTKASMTKQYHKGAASNKINVHSILIVERKICSTATTLAVAIIKTLC